MPSSSQRVDDPATQTENVRKMLLGFSRDLRVVLLRLASRLQTLRYYAASKRPVSPSLAREALHVFAPLANRLGIWQIKWELEDLSFRFLEPETYRQIAKLLDEKRVEREPIWSSCARGSRPSCAPQHQRHRAGPAQAHLQHRQEDARQVAGL
jgi:GTP pyrophosphokinase